MNNRDRRIYRAGQVGRPLTQSQLQRVNRYAWKSAQDGYPPEMEVAENFGMNVLIQWQRHHEISIQRRSEQ